MGYYNEGSMTHYTPDDDDKTIYIESDSSWNITEIIELARKKWGADISLNDICIEAEKIHTRCIYYDLYDPGDYTNYLIIRKTN